MINLQKKELKLFATSASYSRISEAPAYTVCAMRAHILALFRCVFGLFTTEINQRWKLDRLVVVPLLFSSCCRASQTTLLLSTIFDVYITVYIFGSCWSDAFVMFWIVLFQLEFGIRIIHFIRLFYFESVCTYVILIIVLMMFWWVLLHNAL